MAADHGKESIRNVKIPVDDRDEVIPTLNVVDIHARVFLAKLGADYVEQSAGISCAVFAAVADEYSRHGVPSFKQNSRIVDLALAREPATGCGDEGDDEESSLLRLRA